MMRFQRSSRPGRSSRSGGAIGGGGGGGSSAPTLVGSNWAQATTSTVVVSLPAEAAEGDLYIAHSQLRSNYTASTPGVLTGGTALDFYEPYGPIGWWAYKVLTAGDITAGEMSHTGMSNPSITIGTVWSGAGVPSVIEKDTSAGSTTQTFPDINVTAGNVYLISTFIYNDINTESTFSTGFTLVSEQTSLFGLDSTATVAAYTATEDATITPEQTNNQGVNNIWGATILLPGA